MIRRPREWRQAGVGAGAIRELRLGLGLSQERFARLLGVSLQSVRRWENGLSRPLPFISARLEELQKQLEATTTGERIGSASMGSKGHVAGPAEPDLGGLSKGIGNLLDLVAKMAEEGEEEATRAGRVEALGGKLQGVYGFTVRLGLGGRPLVQQFGNIRETGSGLVVTETREPLVDVLDEGDHLLVIVEMPGVGEEDVRLRIEGEILEVVAVTRSRRYRREVLLPTAVDPASLVRSYRNGILEVRIVKR